MPRKLSIQPGKVYTCIASRNPRKRIPLRAVEGKYGLYWETAQTGIPVNGYKPVLLQIGKGK